MRHDLVLFAILTFSVALLRAEERELGSNSGGKIEPEKFAALIEKLDDDAFDERETAMRALLELGPKQQIAVQKALTQTKSLEVRTRLKEILNEYRYMLYEGEPVQGIQLALIPRAKSFEGRTGEVANLRLELRNLSSELLASELGASVEWPDEPSPQRGQGLQALKRAQEKVADAQAKLEIRVFRIGEEDMLQRTIMEKLQDVLKIGELPRTEKRPFNLALQLKESSDLEKMLDRMEKTDDSGPVTLTSMDQYGPGEYEVEVTLTIGQDPKSDVKVNSKTPYIQVHSNKVRITVTAPGGEAQQDVRGIQELRE